MNLPLYQVDAFADRLFAGNPAAIVLYDTPLEPALMQSIAAENNLAETAFVRVGEGTHAIRWFTPTIEVDLCGHATLAAAHVLSEVRGRGDAEYRFDSRSGILSVRIEDELRWLDFPADTLATQSLDGEPWRSILGVDAIECYRGREDWLVIVASESAVEELAPDLSAVAELACRGLIVSAPGRQVDFVLRFFAPQSGIPEDSATGSAQTTLAPYWSHRLGKRNLTAQQLSRRGGAFVCCDQGERVLIGGRAVTYLRGEIVV